MLAYIGALAPQCHLASAAQLDCFTFKVEVLQSTCDGVVTSTAIAPNGTIAGDLDCGFGGIDWGYRWTADRLELLPLPAGMTSVNPQAINDEGTVVGVMKGQTPLLPFVCQPADAPMLLPLLPSFDAGVANSVTEDGDIVGVCIGATELRAVRWLRGQVEELPVSGGPNSEAADIAENGDVCGLYGVSPNYPSSASAFAIIGGVFIDVGTTPQGTGRATAINAFGKVVGYGIGPHPSGTGTTTRGFYWTEGAMTIIEPFPPYTRTAASDMNDGSFVVGTCFGLGLTKPHAFLWHPDFGIVDLNDLIPSDAGVLITGASSINDAGQIEGSGLTASNDVVAVRLTPVPPVVGDLDCDRVVGGSDLAILLGAWGFCSEPRGACASDFDKSGTVDGADLGILLGNWTG